jgi:hypothetical protein
MFVTLLTTALLAPPVSSAQGRGQGDAPGRAGGDRVERVEKPRDGDRRKGQRAEQRRGGKQERKARATATQRADDQRGEERRRSAAREKGRDRSGAQQMTTVRDRRAHDRREGRLRFPDPRPFEPPARMRFRGLDANGDGRIVHREWRGNLVSFQNHDWNGDGVLSGAEVLPGAQRPRRFDRSDHDVRVVRREVRLEPVFTFARDPFGHRVVLPSPRLVTRVDRAFAVAPSMVSVRVPRNVLVVDLGVDLGHPLGLLALPATLLLADALVDDVDLVVRKSRFATFDGDLDGYVTPVEWPAGRRSFRSYDRDGDLLLVHDELFYDDDLVIVDRDRFLLFHGLDRDDDGLIAPWEWPGDLESFFLRDFDGDGVISLDEMMGLVELDRGVRAYRFDVIDFDRDGEIARVEWVADPVRFTRLDRNGNGVVGRWEYAVGWVLDV